MVVEKLLSFGSHEHTTYSSCTRHGGFNGLSRRFCNGPSRLAHIGLSSK